MLRETNGILIRDAKIEDAARLCRWWNDGDVMAHAGFPNGLGTTVARVEAQIKNAGDGAGRKRSALFLI